MDPTASRVSLIIDGNPLVYYSDPLPYSAADLLPFTNGHSEAWAILVNPSDTHLFDIALIELQTGRPRLSYRAARLPPSAAFSTSTRTRTSDDGRVWYVPVEQCGTDSAHLAVLDPAIPGFFREITGLPSLHSVALTSDPDGSILVWAIPNDAGLFAVDENGVVLNHGQPYAPKQNLMHARTHRDSPYLWSLEAHAATPRAFAFQALHDGTGWQVTSLGALRDANGAEMHVDSFALGCHGTAWFVSSLADEVSSLHRFVYRAGMDQGYLAEVVHLPDDRLVQSVWPNQCEKNSAYALLDNGELIRIDADPHASRGPDLRPERRDVESVTPSVEAGLVWITSDGANYLVAEPRDSRPLQLLIGTQRQRLVDVPTKSDSTIWHVVDEKESQDIPSPLRIGAQVRIAVYDKDRTLVSAGEAFVSKPGQVSIAMLEANGVVADRPYHVEATIRFLGSVLVSTWDGVVLKEPLWRRLLHNTLLVAAGLLLAPVVLLSLIFRGNRVAAWSPIYVPFLEFAAAGLRVSSDLSATSVLGVTIAFGLGTIFAGFAFPSLTRGIIMLRPFDRVIPFLLRSKRVRRKFFAPYAAEFRAAIDHRRISAGEMDADAPVTSAVYLQSPLRVVEHKNSGIDTSSTVDSAVIAEGLTRTSACSIVVSGVGGVGKSSLLRELATRAHERFANGDGPVPVWAAGRDPDLSVRVAAALSQLVRKDDIARFLETERTIVFVDGTDELLPSKTAEFMAALRGKTSACFAVREPTDLVELLQTEPSFAHIEPMLLQQDVAEALIQKRAPNITEGQRAATLRISCQSDDAYSPLLITLALKATQGKMRTVVEVFEDVYTTLKPEPSEMIASTADRILRTITRTSMWDRAGEDTDGEQQLRRICRLEPAEGNESAVVEAGIASGLLVRVGPGSPAPLVARYFHDSIASYVLSVAIREQELEDALLTSCSDHRFVAARASFMDFVGPELFQFLVLVHSERAKRLMHRELRRWQTALSGGLTLEDVWNGMHTDFARSCRGETSPKAVLELAVREVEREASSKNLMPLARLYAALAPIAARKRRGTRSGVFRLPTAPQP